MWLMQSNALVKSQKIPPTCCRWFSEVSILSVRVKIAFSICTPFLKPQTHKQNLYIMCSQVYVLHLFHIPMPCSYGSSGITIKPKANKQNFCHDHVNPILHSTIILPKKTCTFSEILLWYFISGTWSKWPHCYFCLIN